MNELIPCPRCRHDNPPENRFCGSCGTALADSGQLVPRLEDSPAAAVRDLPAKLGPTGKALAMGLAAIATEVGLLWLRRRVERTERALLPATQDAKSTVTEYLISDSLEDVSVWLREGDYQRRTFTRRVTRSFGITKPSD
jgi:hypothetical protein